MNQSCLWSQTGKEAGIVRNGSGCILVGTTLVAGKLREVWASLISAGSDYFVCDALHRAHMVLQVVVDRRQDATHGDVLVCEMEEIDSMDIWQAALPSGSAAEKLAFVYDVLLEEAQGDSA